MSTEAMSGVVRVSDGGGNTTTLTCDDGQGPLLANRVMNNVSPASNGGVKVKPPTTTISTIAVKSGDARIVIALLQSKEKLQLKVLDMHPQLTHLGCNLLDATELQTAHSEVLVKLQSKQSPVEELLRKADQLISTQQPKTEVYAAMAESLGMAWKDLNSQLERRKVVLDLNVTYHSRAQVFFERLQALEQACKDTQLPSEVEVVKSLLSKIHELKKCMLEASMCALQDGQILLDMLRGIASQGTLDSRPGQIKISADFAISQVEHWIESLHDRRKIVEVLWMRRKSLLEQCLAYCLLNNDLTDTENNLRVKCEVLQRSDQLGNSASSAELLLHEHNKLQPDAKELQDRILKMTRTSEQLAMSGHYAGDVIKTRAYEVLSICNDYVTMIELRQLLLMDAISFFKSAQTAFTKLDQLEVQVTTSELQTSSPQLAQLHAHTVSAGEEFTLPAINEGRDLLEKVGWGSSGSEGVRATVEELENRKLNLVMLCTAHKEENIQIVSAMNLYLDKFNELFSWLVSIAEAFVQGHQDMGSVLAMAKDFLELHKQLLSDLMFKRTEIEALLKSLPSLLEILDKDQRYDLEHKSDELRTSWSHVCDSVEQRIDLATVYVKFHTLAVQFAQEMETLENMIRSETDGITPQVMNAVEEKWLTMQQLYLQLSKTGKNFIEDTNKVTDPYLDVKRACLCVETLLEHLGSRQLAISELRDVWQKQVTVGREFSEQWERLVMEVTKTTTWVSTLETQFYPVIGDTTQPKIIVRDLENKLQNFVPEVKRAQTEIELRLKHVESLAQKGDTQGQKENLVSGLSTQYKNFQTLLSEYQTLVQMLIAFFKNVAELDKTIENLNIQYHTTLLPNDAAEVESLLKEHLASRQAITELFKFTQNESEQIILRIRQQEPPVAADHDISKIKCMFEAKQKEWELIWEEHKVQLQHHMQLCQFNSDLHKINGQLNDLELQLDNMRGSYGESVATAKATSQAFQNFEKTIEILENHIVSFISTADRLLSEKHLYSQHITKELDLLQHKWNLFLEKVRESRRLIDLSIEYYRLVEEAEEWFKEGSKLLVSIARKSTSVRTSDEATNLLSEVEAFVKPGEVKQEERIQKISNLAVQLYGAQRSQAFETVVRENRELVDSFSLINSELNSLSQNLRTAAEQRAQHLQEKEQVEATLAEAQAEVISARAAAQAAEEARKAAEAAAAALKKAAAQPVYERVEVAKAEALPIFPTPESERPVKEPTPPDAKRAKFVDDFPQPMAPIFTVPLKDITVQEGEKFSFECRVNGFPPPKVTWYKDGIDIENNPDYQTVQDQGICKLNIEETFTEDSAIFTCKAMNAAGTAETSAKLTVQESEPLEALIPPEFTKTLEPKVAREGTSCMLSCVVTGNPLPTVSWFKNDVCIDNSPDYQITFNNGDCILKFEEVFLEDQAEFICRATNSAGMGQCAAKLSVEPLEPTAAPSFVQALSNVMARAGQKLKLECEVAGLPGPEVNWLHNNKPIKETRDIKVLFDGKKASLVISEAFPKDAGTYIVVAKNIAGESTSSCNVSVKGRLPTETSDSELASDIEPVKPTIQLSLQDTRVTEGSKVQFDCVIVGQPEPEVIWYHNERPVKESADFQLLFHGDRCSLIIREAFVEDSGEYKVVAINSAGESSSKCNLVVDVVPDAGKPPRPVIPEDIQPKFTKLLSDIMATEGEKVVFECTLTGRPAPVIQWYKNNVEIPDSMSQPSQAEEYNVSYTIPEVTPDHKGVYTVKATNSLGEGKCFSNLIVKPQVTKEVSEEVTRGPVQKDVVRVDTVEREEAAQFLERFTDQNVMQKQSVTFSCVVKGRPNPKVTWLHKGDRILPTDKAFTISSDGNKHMLHITEALMDHSGQVLCVAENNAGKVSCVASLNVKTLSPAEAVIIPTESKLEEKYESYIMKKTTFMKSDTSESNGLAQPKTEMHSFSSQMEQAKKQISGQPEEMVVAQQSQSVHQEDQQPASVHEKAAFFMSKGGVTTQEKSTENIVTSAPAAIAPPKQRHSMGPRFSMPITGVMIEEGGTIILEGMVDGYPEPEITWFKNGQEIQKKNGMDWTYVHNKVRFELTSASYKDAGRYACTARNKAGSSTSTADVVVRKTAFPPVFGKRLQSQEVKKGSRLYMEVEVTGTPLPEARWYRNGQVIQRGGNVQMKAEGNRHILIIPEVTSLDSGTYTVEAFNQAGKAQSIADVIVRDGMGMPAPQDLHRIVFDDLDEEKKFQSSVSQQRKFMEEIKTEERITYSKVHKEEYSSKTETSSFLKSSLRSPTMLSPDPRPMAMSPTPIITSPAPTPEPPKMPVEVIREVKIETNQSTQTEEEEKPLSVKLRIENLQKQVDAEQQQSETREQKTAELPSYDFKAKIDDYQKQVEQQETTEIKQEDVPVVDIKSRIESFQNQQFEHQEETESKPTEEPEEMPFVDIKSRIEGYQQQVASETAMAESRPVDVEVPQVSIKSKIEGFQRVITETESVPETWQKVTSPPPLRREFLKSPPPQNVPTPPSVFEQPPKFSGPPRPVIDLPKLSTQNSYSSSRTYSRFESQKFEQSSLEELGLKPEPPPEMGYAPKVEGPTKVREDIPGRIKRLEEVHKSSSPQPVDIPGAVRIFPPLKSEAPPVSSVRSFEQVHSREVYQSPSSVKTAAVCQQTRKEVYQTQPLEPFPFKPDEPRPRPAMTSPLPTPSKFVKSDFKETATYDSSQECDYAPVWSPSQEPSKPKKLNKQWPPPPVSDTEEQTIQTFTKTEVRQQQQQQQQQLPQPFVKSPVPPVGTHYPVAPVKSPQPPVMQRPITPAMTPQPPVTQRPITPAMTPQPPVSQRPITPATALSPLPYDARPTSPRPSAEGVAMDKMWGQKHVHSYLKPSWPPQPSETETESKRILPWVQQDSSAITSQTEVVRQQAEQKTYESSTVSQEAAVTATVDQEESVVKETLVKPSQIHKSWPYRSQPDQQVPKFIPQKQSEPSLKPGSPPQYVYAAQPAPPAPQKQIQDSSSTFQSRIQQNKTRTVSSTSQKQEAVYESISSDKHTQFQKTCVEKPLPQLEPFPFHPDPPRERGPRVPPPPTPSKFIKGEFQERNYDSEYELKFTSKWHPYESDPEDNSYYRPVKPRLETRPRPRSSTGEKAPTPPSEFDKGPVLDGPPRPKFQPIDRVKSPGKSLFTSVVKPVPLTNKSTPSVALPKPGTPPKEEYAPPPHQSQPKGVQVEASKSMHFEESTQYSRRVVTMEQTTKVIRFGEQQTVESCPVRPGSPPKVMYAEPPMKQSKFDRPQQPAKQPVKSILKETERSRKSAVKSKTEKFQSLEPFPFRPEPDRPKPIHKGPPPPKPSKFVKGDFHESDYDSEFEGVRIKPKWAPSDSDTEDLHYRPVRPPSRGTPTQRYAESGGTTPVPPTEFEQPPAVEWPPRPKIGPVEKETKIPQQQGNVQAEQMRLRRVEEMRKRFGGIVSSDTTKTSVARSVNIAQTPSTAVVLKPGEPPIYGHTGQTRDASEKATHHFGEMSQSFRTKTHSFAQQIQSDMTERRQHQQQEDTKSSQEIVKRDVEDNEPRTYREESKLAEFGTKQIDPETGLIYFKYDFGYEFGIVLPGEGKRPGKAIRGGRGGSQLAKRLKEGDIEVPIIHESTHPSKKTTFAGVQQQHPRPTRGRGVVPQFRPKRFTQFKANKWDPMSESEMSEAEDVPYRPSQFYGRHTLPRARPLSHPGKWDTPSPRSLSPCSTSPRPVSWSALSVDVSSGRGASLSPMQSPLKRPLSSSLGRGITPTPPSTPRSDGLTPRPGSHPKTAPSFIKGLQDRTVPSGSCLQFECMVKGEPVPSILWSKNGRAIESSPDYQIRHTSGICTLLIPEVFAEDAGLYACTATNNLGSTATTSFLRVSGEKLTFPPS